MCKCKIFLQGLQKDVLPSQTSALHQLMHRWICQGTGSWHGFFPQLECHGTVLPDSGADILDKFLQLVISASFEVGLEQMTKHRVVDGAGEIQQVHNDHIKDGGPRLIFDPFKGVWYAIQYTLKTS